MDRDKTPLPDRVRAFEGFAPLVTSLRKLQRGCRPFGRDYSAVAVSIAAMEDLARHYTSRRGFYGAQNDTVGPIAQWDDEA